MYLKLVCIYVKQEIICHIYEVPYMFHILYFRMGRPRGQCRRRGPRHQGRRSRPSTFEDKVLKVLDLVLEVLDVEDEVKHEVEDDDVCRRRRGRLRPRPWHRGPRGRGP